LLIGEWKNVYNFFYTNKCFIYFSTFQQFILLILN
jgi:hypothetical protein